VADLRSKERRVVVDFQGVPELEPDHQRFLEAAQGERLTFALAGDVADFLAQITARYQIRDLVVEHPPIEETVARLYQHESVGRE
jgi:ABC-type uncharacterized transport system ATPase subunit